MSVQARLANHKENASMQTGGRSNASSRPKLQQLMIGYQKADAVATTALVELLSPQLYRFFAAPPGSGSYADDMLQELWLHIHKARRTYRAGEPLIAWVYAIARHVRMDNHRRRHRIAMRQLAAGVLPEVPPEDHKPDELPSFDAFVAALPESQRELMVLLKVNGLSFGEIARATASTVRVVKQKTHRAYRRLRNLLQQTPTAGELR